MKVGFYENDLQDVSGEYDIDDENVIQDVASDFADEHHQIVEGSDMDFKVYVKDDESNLHEVKFYTEFDPRFEVDSVKRS